LPRPEVRLEIHPDDPNPPTPDLTLFLDRRYVRSGYSWSFPADGASFNVLSTRTPWSPS
jgi:hypothetical protein